VDLDDRDPRRVIGIAHRPLLDVGSPGSFDDNGVVVTSVVAVDQKLFFMYYAGFELCEKIRYRIFTGIAVSEDGGDSFHRIQAVPILDRSHEEQFFRCGAFARYEADRFRLWYVAGNSWTNVRGKLLPVYDLRYLESPDGTRWGPQGTVCLSLVDPDEHGFGRPWIVKQQAEYELFYSIRRRSLMAYRLGYAKSVDGLHWTRNDAELGLDVSPDGFDNQAVMYSALVKIQNKTYCFYNGNHFGRDGFALAELVE